MINHARTLLLNIFPQTAHMQDAGYAYIPTTFKPIKLPSAVATIRRLLFGAQPDQRFLNLRARELLSYIHETELGQYLYALDSRVTYWPEPADLTFKYRPSFDIVQISGPRRKIATSGEFFATNGKAKQQYLLTLNEETNGYTLHLQNTKIPTANETATFDSFENAPSILVPETQIRFRLDGLVDPTAPITNHASVWEFKIEANPMPAITTLLPTLELLGEPVFLELFGVAPVEPFNTFKNVWFDHQLPTYRLAGFVLAVIYRTEEARNKNNG